MFESHTSTRIVISMVKKSGKKSTGWEFLRNSEPCDVSILSSPLKKPRDCMTGMKLTQTSPARIWPFERETSSLYSCIFPVRLSDCAWATGASSRQAAASEYAMGRLSFIVSGRLAAAEGLRKIPCCHDITRHDGLATAPSLASREIVAWDSGV